MFNKVLSYQISIFLILLASTKCEGKWSIECYEERISHCFASVKETKLTDQDSGKVINVDHFKHIKVFNLQTNKTLDEIPKNLFTDFNDLIYVKINANIDKLQSNTFNGGNNIEYLNLAFNRFNEIPTNVFLPLKNLKYLWLSLNRIQKIDNKMFDHLNQLEYLDLSYNQLKVLNDNSFTSLKKLTTLLLIGNQIENIDQMAFNMKSLKTIVLDQNNLKQLPAKLFGFSKNLEAISLADNQLNYIDFNLPEKLNYLNIGHNPMQKSIDLQNMLNYKNLNVLLMSNVSAEIVFPNNHAIKSTVTRLNLSYNSKLNGETILYQLKNTFPNIEYLNLEGNDFQTLFGLNDIQKLFPKLNELYIGCNSFDCKWLKDQINNLKFNFELFSCSQPIERRHQNKRIETIDCI